MKLIACTLNLQLFFLNPSQPATSATDGTPCKEGGYASAVIKPPLAGAFSVPHNCIRRIYAIQECCLSCLPQIEWILEVNVLAKIGR
jgi:hypothetical protein